MQGLSAAENTMLGGAAAFVEAIVLQPTLYWKNARMQGLPFTMNLRTLYRGIDAALVNEMGQMGLQFGLTGLVQKLIVGDDDRKMKPREEIQAAFAGGALSAFLTSPLELFMVQQQRFGGSLAGCCLRVYQDFGFTQGVYRGFMPSMCREGIYVSGLLGVTPVVQDYMVSQGWGLTSSGLYASLGAGFVVGVASCPFDCIKVCMSGDLQQKEFQGFTATYQTLMKQGGVRRLFAGVTWRAINIVGTIYIANECRVRLAPIMFPDAKFFHQTSSGH